MTRMQSWRGIWVAAALLTVCAGEDSAPRTPTPLFEDRSARSGVDMLLKNGATGAKHQIETMAGGVAIFDYDGDGRPDLYFANGATQPNLGKPDPSYHNRLYRNKGGWQFEDVTAKAGVPGTGFHFGVA